MSARTDGEEFLARYASRGLLEALHLSLSVADGPHRRTCVQCVARVEVPDTVNPGEDFLAYTRFDLDLTRSDEHNHRQLFTALWDRLRHEIAEGITFDGNAPLDPHNRPQTWPYSVRARTEDPHE